MIFSCYSSGTVISGNSTSCCTGLYGSRCSINSGNSTGLRASINCSIKFTMTNDSGVLTTDTTNTLFFVRICNYAFHNQIFYCTILRNIAEQSCNIAIATIIQSFDHMLFSIEGSGKDRNRYIIYTSQIQISSQNHGFISGPFINMTVFRHLQKIFHTGNSNIFILIGICICIFHRHQHHYQYHT